MDSISLDAAVRAGDTGLPVYWHNRSYSDAFATIFIDLVHAVGLDGAMAEMKRYYPTHPKCALPRARQDEQQLRSRFVVRVLRHELAAHGQIKDESAQAGNRVGRVGDLFIVRQKAFGVHASGGPSKGIKGSSAAISGPSWSRTTDQTRSSRTSA